MNDFETVYLDDKARKLVILDQTKLPNEITYLSLNDPKEIWEAIYLLKVRGAPAIGVSAAIGLWAILARERYSSKDQFFTRLHQMVEYLDSARPTAVNLSWALEVMEQEAVGHRDFSVDGILQVLHDKAVRIREDDIAMCKAIGEHALTLVKPGDGLLTHCNAGRLATVKYGTATAVMYLGQERGYHFHVFCDETRPLLQGARLTAFELHQAGIDVTLECDGMSASAMRKGLVQAVFVGADRVAANGDFANKIGTSMLALAAWRYHVPFYCCAPSSSIDFSTASGDGIVIEERKPEEVTDMWYQAPMAPRGIKVFNPAFDVTDHDLVTGIITEKGIARYPYDQSLRRMLG